MKMRMKKGFTLVEIMIVVAIIAILAAVAIPNFIKYRNDSRKAACIGNMKEIQTAAESYLTQNPSTTAPTMDNLLNSDDGAGYFKVKPVCPTDSRDYTIAFDGNNAVTVTCKNSADGHVLPGNEATSPTSPAAPEG